MDILKWTAAALILLALEAMVPEHRGEEGRGLRRAATP